MATNDQFTIRAREALAAAAELARVNGNPEITPEHLLLALTAEPDATASVLLRGAGADREAVRSHAEARARQAAHGQRRDHRRSSPRWRSARRSTAPARRRATSATSSSPSSTCCSRWPTGSGAAARRAPRCWRPRASCAARQRADDENAEERYDSLSRFGRDLTAIAESGKLDPGDRTRRRGPPRDAGAFTAHQEQPRPDRGARRWQDRDCRGPRAAHRRGRRAREPQGAAHLGARPGRAAGRLEVPRRVRGAPQGRARGDLLGRRPHHPVHRRAAHDRRRGRGRGRGRRGQPAQAHARARRAARDRRDHARRVPQAHREGRRARAALRARVRRRALRAGHDRASCAACASATRCTTACASWTPR